MIGPGYLARLAERREHAAAEAGVPAPEDAAITRTARHHAPDRRPWWRRIAIRRHGHHHRRPT